MNTNSLHSRIFTRSTSVLGDGLESDYDADVDSFELSLSPSDRQIASSVPRTKKPSNKKKKVVAEKSSFPKLFLGKPRAPFFGVLSRKTVSPFPRTTKKPSNNVKFVAEKSSSEFFPREASRTFLRWTDWQSKSRDESPRAPFRRLSTEKTDSTTGFGTTPAIEDPSPEANNACRTEAEDARWQRR